MAGTRREDIRVKMPALLHLTRLGYLYTPRGTLGRETETNLLPAVLKGAVERINGITLGEEEEAGLLEGLRDLMNRQDQGRDFTKTLREGWRGLKLLDYGHPERNVFQAAAEVTCTQGRKRFTPDITLYVNGLPLVMIEVKTRDLKDGILVEYDRMRERLRTGEFRPFLQAAQLWVFSNDSEVDDGDLMPKKGTFFAAAAGGEFPLREWRPGSFSGARVSARLDPAVEADALRDQGMTEIRTAPGYRRLTSPQTPTHRMMTALLKPERLLFLIRYGVQYTSETETPGRIVLHRRMLDAEQMSNLYRMERKLQRGFRNWTIPCVRPGGRITMAAAAIPLLRERIPGCLIFWVCSDRRESLRADAEFRSAGFQPGEIRILSADQEMQANTENGGQGVFFLPETGDRYEVGRQLKNRIRALDRDAILIVMGREAPRERAGYTYMLRCADGSLYCGWTTDLKKRLDTHNAGKGARYTRSRRPVELVWWEEHATKEEAMSREWHIKQMTRQEKERLILETEERR